MASYEHRTGKHVHVPLDIALYNEFVLRTGNPTVDVSAYVKDALIDLLKKEPKGSVFWGLDSVGQAIREVEDENYKRCGDPSKGYQWQTLFLPNGSRLRMKYNGKDHYAEIQHQKIMYDGESHSPSGLAYKIANHTSRNAWRDLWVSSQFSTKWELADTLRKSQS